MNVRDFFMRKKLTKRTEHPEIVQNILGIIIASIIGALTIISYFYDLIGTRKQLRKIKKNSHNDEAINLKKHIKGHNDTDL